jgi:hypothetical protein
MKARKPLNVGKGFRQVRSAALSSRVNEALMLIVNQSAYAQRLKSWILLGLKNLGFLKPIISGVSFKVE